MISNASKSRVWAVGCQLPDLDANGRVSLSVSFFWRSGGSSAHLFTKLYWFRFKIVLTSSMLFHILQFRRSSRVHGWRYAGIWNHMSHCRRFLLPRGFSATVRRLVFQLVKAFRTKTKSVRGWCSNWRVDTELLNAQTLQTSRRTPESHQLGMLCLSFLLL